MARSSTKYCGNQTDKNVEFLLKISMNPRVAIIVLVTDDMVVVPSLPDIMTDLAIDVPFQQGYKFRNDLMLTMFG